MMDSKLPDFEDYLKYSLAKLTIRIPVHVKMLSSTAKLPTYSTASAACADLYADEDLIFWPGDVRKIHTGIAMSIPRGYFGAIYPRSGFATNKGARLANGTGIIDSDYRGEIIIPLVNGGDNSISIHKGDRIAQIAILPVERVAFLEAADLDTTQRGEGGFGSTGIV